MTSIRQFIYDRLVAIPDFVEVYQGESVLEAPNRSEYPVAVYRIGNESPEFGMGEQTEVHRKYFQVYIHDTPADYTRIDDLVDKVKAAFVMPTSVGKITQVIYLETSRDLDDAFFGSIMRYVRFQAVLTSN